MSRSQVFSIAADLGQIPAGGETEATGRARIASGKPLARLAQRGGPASERIRGMLLSASRAGASSPATSRTTRTAASRCSAWGRALRGRARRGRTRPPRIPRWSVLALDDTYNLEPNFKTRASALLGPGR
jgi:hypothetical protein